MWTSHAFAVQRCEQDFLRCISWLQVLPAVSCGADSCLDDKLTKIKSEVHVMLLVAVTQAMLLEASSCCSFCKRRLLVSDDLKPLQGSMHSCMTCLLVMRTLQGLPNDMHILLFHTSICGTDFVYIILLKLRVTTAMHSTQEHVLHYVCILQASRWACSQVAYQCCKGLRRPTCPPMWSPSITQLSWCKLLCNVQT